MLRPTPARLQRVTLSPEQRSVVELGVAFSLTEEQVHYLQRVLRLGMGDQFIAMDGQGKRWLAILEKQGAVAIEELPWSREVPRQIHLAIGMPKGAGMESIIRQSTELGVHRITPLLCERSVLAPSDHKLQRWQRIAQEAAELAQRSVVPPIEAPVSFPQFLLEFREGDRFIGVTHPNIPHVITFPPSNAPATIVTGPEGGWSEAEESTAIGLGWQPISLGAGVLSATTAPVVALAVVSANSYLLSRSE